MGDVKSDLKHSSDELDDRKPVDSFVVSPRAPAVAADGEPVSPGELESAAELSRMARRLGLDKRGVNGFHLYAAYLVYRDFRRLSTRAFGRARSLAKRHR